MLFLLPLRLWAGALMPMAMPDNVHSFAGSALHATQANLIHDRSVTTGLTTHHSAQFEHHAMATLDSSASIHSSHALDADAHPSPDNCNEGPGCIACSVCHLSADVPDSTSRLSDNKVHAIPANVAATWLGRALPPLIKPPIV